MTNPKVAALLRPAGTLTPLTRRAQTFDVLLALSLILIAVIAGGANGFTGKIHRSPIEVHPRTELFPPIEQHQNGWAAVFLLVVAPLALRRRYPLATLWTTLLLAPLVADYDAALRLSFYACVIAAYTAAVYSPYRIPALASLLPAAITYAGLKDGPPDIPPGFVPILILSAIAVAADGLRRWKHRADQRAEALHHAVARERARIARELHDVVTHNVSMMIIQAGAARKVLDSHPAQSREALLNIEAAGRSAMTELRHVMGLLTPDTSPTDSAGFAPQPGLDRLDALITQVTASGTPVTLTTTGHPRPTPPGISLTAYRIVQEALTNTVKHAPGATATVQVEYTPHHLHITITDTGPLAGPTLTGPGGRGLIGLHERLDLYGGTLHTGPRLTGGYRVDAEIPWPPHDPAPTPHHTARPTSRAEPEHW